jgi:hypothetical protein
MDYAKAQKIQRDDLPVRVIGQLFYDNKHFVRDRSGANERTNQSKRHSLWKFIGDEILGMPRSDLFTG